MRWSGIACRRALWEVTIRSMRTRWSFFLLTALASSACTSTPQPMPPTAAYSSVWQARIDVVDDAVFADVAEHGFRMVDLSGYSVNGEQRYAGVWQFADGRGWDERHGLTRQALEASLVDHDKVAARIVHLTAWSGADGPRFAAIWDSAQGPLRTAKIGLSAVELEVAEREATSHDARMIDVCGWTEDGASRFAAIWEASPKDVVSAVHVDLTPTALDALLADAAARSLRPIRVAGYEASDGSARFVALTTPYLGAMWLVRHDLDAADYQKGLEEMVGIGYRIEQLSAYVLGDRPRFVALWSQ